MGWCGGCGCWRSQSGDEGIHVHTLATAGIHLAQGSSRRPPGVQQRQVQIGTEHGEPAGPEDGGVADHDTLSRLAQPWRGRVRNASRPAPCSARADPRVADPAAHSCDLRWSGTCTATSPHHGGLDAYGVPGVVRRYRLACGGVDGGVDQLPADAAEFARHPAATGLCVAGRHRPLRRRPPPASASPTASAPDGSPRRREVGQAQDEDGRRWRRATVWISRGGRPRAGNSAARWAAVRRRAWASSGRGRRRIGAYGSSTRAPAVGGGRVEGVRRNGTRVPSAWMRSPRCCTWPGRAHGHEPGSTA